MSHIIWIFVAGAIGFIAGVRLTRLYVKKKENAYRLALETRQKSGEETTARLNILLRFLDDLPVYINDPITSESWKNYAINEAKALLLGDQAYFWTFNEKDQVLELECVQGSEPLQASIKSRLEIEDGGLWEAVKTRSPKIIGSTELAFPVLVAGVIRGVFQVLRAAARPFEEKDLNVGAVFFKQLGLVLDNGDMLRNRETFYIELVQALADAIDSRDITTEGQTRRARALARKVGKEMGLPDEFLYYLELAALVHDIGNLSIDQQLLRKPGKLTAQEFEIVKRHPEMGYKILAPVSMLAPVAPMVLYHQEWYNGKGYPEGLKGEEIPLGARIVAVLDAWGSMTSDRAWRKSLGRDIAAQELNRGAGTQFDPKVVEAFLSVLES